VCVSALVAGGPVSCAVRRVCRLFLVVASPQGRDETTTGGHVTAGFTATPWAPAASQDKAAAGSGACRIGRT